MTRKVQLNVIKEIENSIELGEDKEDLKEMNFEEKANNSNSEEESSKTYDFIMNNNKDFIKYIKDNPIHLEDDLLNNVLDEDNEKSDSIEENENKENSTFNLNS